MDNYRGLIEIGEKTRRWRVVEDIPTLARGNEKNEKKTLLNHFCKYSTSPLRAKVLRITF